MYFLVDLPNFTSHYDLYGSFRPCSGFDVTNHPKKLLQIIKVVVLDQTEEALRTMVLTTRNEATKTAALVTTISLRVGLEIDL